jgi:hypothetical protein
LPWSTKFEDPIPHPGGGTIKTLEDAAIYVTALPKKVYDQPHWQLAMEQLIMAAEDRGPLLHARIGMMKALNYGKPARTGQRRAKKYRMVR